MGASADAQTGRLLWRCRRGMKELDLLLSGYLRNRWAAAATAERAAFERILELPDPLLAAYLMQRDAPDDPHMQSLLAILRGEDARFVANPAGPPTASGSAKS